MSISISNKFERATGHRIGDGMYKAYTKEALADFLREVPDSTLQICLHAIQTEHASPTEQRKALHG